MTDLFVTGMLRSGTTLVQVLLTNHPDAVVVYQPFHQLYVDVKARFLDEQGTQRLLPLSDAMDVPDEPQRFREWLRARRFDAAEAAALAGAAATGKGGGAPELATLLRASPGSFFDIRRQLHEQLLAHLDPPEAASHVGSKEILCEEYVPALLAARSQCVLVVRDPRAVIASANFGTYRHRVGDRYPLLMLIRLWRKSVAHWLSLRGHPALARVRYEDIVTSTAASLEMLRGELDLAPFPEGIWAEELRDHAGAPWRSNSSFGQKVGVDASSVIAWRSRLGADMARFIEACCLPELQAMNYEVTLDVDEADDAISRFREDERGVRRHYLDLYRLDERSRRRERERLEDGIFS